MGSKNRQYTLFGAIFVTVVALIAFLATVAPSVSFWDCGEYIGASHSLGIPHPPGNPLYVLLGRAFSILLPFFNQVGYRVNLISVFSGAFTAMFIFLIIVRVFRSWMGEPDTSWKRLTVYLSGIMGAFFAVFGYTFWFSAVEASVYIPSMLFVSAVTWLALVWYQSKSDNRDRYLILISYLVFLSIGIHMMGMIAMAPIGLFVFLSDKEKLKDRRLWFVGIGMASVIWQPSMFLSFGPLLLIMTAVYALFNYRDARYVNLTIFGLLAAITLFIEFGALNSGQIDGGTFFSIVLPFLAVFGFTLAELLATEPIGGVQIKREWRFLFWLVAFAILGYSVHAYIPIRSALNPIIDENHPVVTWDASKMPPVNMDNFRYFLERKQYGSESMIKRMFWPRASRLRQFGIDGHMGYGGFHITQFFHFGKSIGMDRENTVFQNYGAAGGLFRLLLYLIPTAMAFFGWLYVWKRNRTVAIYTIVLMLMGTVVLVFYMNFADGTRPELRDYKAWVSQGKPGPMPTVHREVRIRDYFFTAGFMFFGMWIGIAAGCILHALFTNKNRFLRTRVAPILVVLFAVSPVLPIVQNGPENNRTRDWVPYDYAYNLLMSCEKDGILFTNGDNDTFPLWMLQEAMGIRKDVRIVNLSLLNTKWYIKQLKNLEPIVPISYSEKEIEEELNHSLNPFPKTFAYKLPKAAITVNVPGRQEHNALRIQDQMVLNIVDANKWKKPIYFAVTVSNDNLMGLQPYLQMQGLVYRVQNERVGRNERIDIDRTLYYLDNVYQFRGLGNGEAPMSETARKLMSNYAAGFIQVAMALDDQLRKLNSEIVTLEADTTSATPRLAAKRAEYEEKLDTAIRKLDECVNLMPWDWRPRLLRQEVMITHGRHEGALERVQRARLIEPGRTEYLQMEAQLLDKLGRHDEANQIWQQLASNDVDPWRAYLSMATNFTDMGMYDSAISVMKQFLKHHPGDRRANAMIARMETMKAEQASQAIEQPVTEETVGNPN